MIFLNVSYGIAAKVSANELGGFVVAIFVRCDSSAIANND